MQTFNYKPKSDIKTLLKNYWPIVLSVGLAIWFILQPAGIRLFRIIRIPYPISAILLSVIAIAVIVYYVFIKIPRLKRDLMHSKPITIENGIVKYTKTKGGLPKDITFNLSDVKVYHVDDDDDEFSMTAGEEDITFYANYFDDDTKYQEFKRLIGVVNK